MPIETIDAHEYKARLDAAPRLTIDVRQPNEFRALHVACAHLYPLSELTPEGVVAHRRAAGVPESEPVYVLCQTGRRARTAAERLARETPHTWIVVEGGTVACHAAGIPTRQGEIAISIERQVRIASGSLVMLGVLLATLVTPYANALSAIVGAGLVFAGVTDSCAMGMLLAKMPWNGRAKSCAA